MTHVVAGYPTTDLCIELLLGMQEAGVCAIEVQIPFSDPSADGALIMHANDVAIQNRMTINQCFKMIQNARKKGLNIPIYIMCYANKLYNYGFEVFCKNSVKCGVFGFIVPDLPHDTNEYSELRQFANTNGIEIVPVLSPGIQSDRVKMYQLHKTKLVYITSMKGITGNKLIIRSDLIHLIRTIRKQSDCEIALGFGIRTIVHVDMALEIADIAVVGSEVIRHIDRNNVSGAIKFVSQLVAGQKYSSISGNSTILGDNDE